jgi:hypothetical protein
MAVWGRRRKFENFEQNNSFRIHLPLKMEQTQCSETSAIKHHTPENDPKGFYPHSFRIHSPMKMEQTQCSETSAIKHHTPENDPKVYKRHKI